MIALVGGGGRNRGWEADSRACAPNYHIITHCPREMKAEGTKESNLHQPVNTDFLVVQILYLPTSQSPSIFAPLTPQMVFQKPCLNNMTQPRADFFFFLNPPSHCPSELDQSESQELRGRESPSLHGVGLKICIVEPTQNSQIKQRIPTEVQIFDKKYRIFLFKYVQILERKHT